MTGVNKQWAPKATKAHAMSRLVAESILDRANSPATYVRRSGRRSVITRFEAAVIRLATLPAQGRKANLDFIECVLDAARTLQELELADIRNGVYLQQALERGSEEECEAEFHRYLDALPRLDELNERDLMALYNQAGQAI